MAAPTPVSALVHSSTLVTAGVYLLIRLYLVFEGAVWVHGVLLAVGRVTMFLAGVAAFAEYDFKKVVAYSTLSQLGVMVVGLGLGLPSLSFFHLLSHAMFKALLFVCVGAVIHIRGHVQDVRGLGDFGRRGLFVQAGMVLSDLALCGFPFLRGFFSKDVILEHRFVSEGGWVFLVMGVIATALTTSYSARVVMLGQVELSAGASLVGERRGDVWFFVPIGMLGGIRVVWGGVLNWVLVPFVRMAGVGGVVAFLPMVRILFGFCLFWGWGLVELEGWRLKVVLAGKLVWRKDGTVLREDRFRRAWFLDRVSSQYVVRRPLGLAERFVVEVEQGWGEEVVSQGGLKVSKAVL